MNNHNKNKIPEHGPNYNYFHPGYGYDDGEIYGPF